MIVVVIIKPMMEMVLIMMNMKVVMSFGVGRRRKLGKSKGKDRNQVRYFSAPAIVRL